MTGETKLKSKYEKKAVSKSHKSFLNHAKQIAYDDLLTIG